MKITRMILVLLLAITATAQSAQAPAPVKVPPDYAKQLADLEKQSEKLATDNAQLLAAYQKYMAMQSEMRGQYQLVATRAAMAAHLTVEQLDNSELKSDGKGGYEWVPKPAAASAKK